MRSVVDWIKKESDSSKDWLILGKGPTFALRGSYDLTQYNTLGLNHVVKVHLSTLNHFADLDAFTSCAAVLVESKARTVMPWFPHIENKPGKCNLKDMARLVPSLGELAGGNLLLTYNSTLAKIKNKHLPAIRVRFFSAVAALNILAAAGVKKIFSLGVDGGSSYADDFSQDTLLCNGRASFSDQFPEMAATIKKHKIEYIPLTHTK